MLATIAVAWALSAAARMAVAAGPAVPHHRALCIGTAMAPQQSSIDVHTNMTTLYSVYRLR